MGAWGIGNFENDNAGDWVWDLEKSKDKSVLHAALSSAANTPNPEASQCNEALAAAEVVLAGITGDQSRIPDEAAKWITSKTGFVFKKRKSFGAEDARIAIAAIENILKESELLDLWNESDEGANWRELQVQLIKGLAPHV